MSLKIVRKSDFKDFCLDQKKQGENHRKMLFINAAHKYLTNATKFAQVDFKAC